MQSERRTEQRVNLYYDLYVPESVASKPRPLVVAFHGYEGNKESMMALMQKINSEDLIIASVQGPNSFFVRDGSEPNKPRIGFGWMMQYKAEETIRLHHETLLTVIRDIEAEHPIDRRAIFSIAFSQSVSLNYRFAFTHPGLVRGVVAVCGGIPGDWDQDKYQESDTDVLIIAGENDEFYPLERTHTFKDAIAKRARSVEFRTFPGGHVFARETLPIINEWIKTRLGTD
ncbi:MAG TPA: dienelactone hydrolase family protein [Blastocatellia bacterium]|nr:dienelactone hydrolase family protein [Blastocatellia bacterium]